MVAMWRAFRRFCGAVVASSLEAHKRAPSALSSALPPRTIALRSYYRSHATLQRILRSSRAAYDNLTVSFVHSLRRVCVAALFASALTLHCVRCLAHLRWRRAGTAHSAMVYPSAPFLPPAFPAVTMRAEPSLRAGVVGVIIRSAPLRAMLRWRRTASLGRRRSMMAGSVSTNINGVVCT